MTLSGSGAMADIIDGHSMKYIKNISLLFSCVFIILFFNGCVDPTVTTEIKVINKSSYDLFISFIT